jgi:hypothetical protein
MKERFHRPASVIAEGTGRLCEDILNAKSIQRNSFLEVLLVAPPPIDSMTPELQPDFSGAVEKSSQLSAIYCMIAQRLGIQCMDAGAFICVSRDDPVHWDRSAHLSLGLAMADRVLELIDERGTVGA